MSEPTAAEMTITPPRKSFWRNLSFVWLVPLLALAVSLGIAWQNYADRGTLVTISFRNASGVIAGETTLKYREVVVGEVEDVTFTEDLGQVLVHVRVDNEVAPFMDADSAFWVVRPVVSTRGITGLSTVLTGVYIEGAWDNVAEDPQTSFRGSDTPPLVQPGRPGKRITLATDDGTTISYGSPVLYRGVEVGRLETPRLSADGRSVVVDAFIDAPHDNLLTRATRFWDTSGFELSIGTAGFEVDFDSIASLLTGGIEFDNIYDDGGDIGPGYVFTLYEDEEEARRNRLVQGIRRGVAFSIQFAESVAGLEAGDEVTYQGLDVGVVTELRSRAIETEFGPQISLFADVSIDPQRMGLPPGTTEAETVEFFRFAVTTGLRARLATESLLSSDLRIELVVVDDAATAFLSEPEGSKPILPSVESNLSDFTATAEGVLERINALPIEEVMEQAINLMASIEDLARHEDVLRVPGSTVALLEDTRNLIASEAVQGIPDQLAAATTDLQAMIAEVRESGAIAALNSALVQLDEAMAGINAASKHAPELTENLVQLTEEDIPTLLAELEAVATTAKALDLDALVTGATQTVNRIDALIAQEAVQRIPSAVEAAIGDVRNVLARLDEEGAVQTFGSALRNLDKVMADVSIASQDAPALTANLRAITETDVPELLAELRELATAANTLDLDSLVNGATQAVTRIDTLIAQEAVQNIPASIDGALADLRKILADLDEEGAVDALGSALRNLDRVMADASVASQDAPALTANLRAITETEVPALLADLRQLAASANALDLDALVTGATQTVNRIDALIAQEAVQSIPANIDGAITGVREVLAKLDEEGAVDALGSALRNLDRVMADVSIASQDAPALTANLKAITETDIPELLAEIEAVATTAKELELQTLVDSATRMLTRVDDLVASDDAQALPGALNGALTQMRLALTELREGGVVENLNATLQSASDAAGSVATSVEDLPQLTARLERLVIETQAVVTAYGARSDFNSQTLAALREIQNAAKSVSELARAIERSPNSLIFGR